MNVEQYGRGQMSVSSADRDGVKYTVDLTENAPNGVCNCVDFGTRCQQRWDVTKVVKEYGDINRTRCKHINAAIMFLGNAVVAQLNRA